MELIPFFQLPIMFKSSLPSLKHFLRAFSSRLIWKFVYLYSPRTPQTQLPTQH